MYKIQTTFVIAAAHRLQLGYASPCQNLHGHNWKITVHCQAEELDASGMVLDFTLVKRSVVDVLDHGVVNDVLQGNPTAENIARWVCDRIGPKCFKVEVQESEGNVAVYER